ncbi:MAG: GyrI-like domain-containing protein [Bacteroidota bacterium]
MTPLQPRIVELQEKNLIGVSVTMSVTHNLTGQLWGSFMPRRSEITHRANTDFMSMQIYDEAYFKGFSPTREFTKWAAVEVSNNTIIPKGMSTMTIPSGLYAVFDYKGMSGNPAIFQYIFSEWLPQSEYQLDHRPHFEVLGEKYKNNDPNSEEEIWIPIR